MELKNIFKKSLWFMTCAGIVLTGAAYVRAPALSGTAGADDSCVPAVCGLLYFLRLWRVRVGTVHGAEQWPDFGNYLVYENAGFPDRCLLCWVSKVFGMRSSWQKRFP